MSSAAEKYAASRVKANDNKTMVGAFTADYAFDLDPFQLDAIRAIESGKGVLVAAPTGAGKTVVGEFAIYRALNSGTKCFYTTPIKALSNQKYAELVERYGAENVGLLTGDNSINGEAPIVVMTTEVLRNMLYAHSSTLKNLAYVVMDEVHYLADRSRGAVWEEVIIHLPDSVTIIALSATVSNAEEFGRWLATIRGETEVIVEEIRPVPLWQHVMAGKRLYDLFIDDSQHEVNPELAALARNSSQAAANRSRSKYGSKGRTAPRRTTLTPWRSDVVALLETEVLLPAIYFLFSRAGCDDAVEQILSSGLRLTTTTEREKIRNQVLESTRDIPDEDLAALGFSDWIDALERGVAAHHAGALPRFKEIVESLFQQGLLKVVFATETLALGINMPAKSVVLERLVKWNGDAHVDLSPGEYTQITGRAGRRGIDVEGHAVVLWQQDLDPKSLAGLASTRTYPLKSSFRPSYNMAVNLVGSIGTERARELLETSFAQFQADASVVGLATELRKLEEAKAGYFESMQCHLGDFEQYSALRHEISVAERQDSRASVKVRRDLGESQLRTLKVGDVIMLTSGKKAGPAVVVSPAINSPKVEPRPMVLTGDRQVRRLNHHDALVDLAPIGRLRVPKNFSSRDAHIKKSLAQQVRDLGQKAADPKRRGKKSHEVNPVVQDLRDQMRAHPCHGCDEREAHARWGERYQKTESQYQEVASRMKGRTNTIARRFDRLCSVLGSLDYLAKNSQGEWKVTERGTLLTGVYSENDLLIAQTILAGVLDQLDPATLAAVCSTFVYESRRGDSDEAPSVPGGPTQKALDEIHQIWGQVEGVEHEHRVNENRTLDAGLAWAVYRWAKGATLMRILTSNDVTAGDFVRWVRQVIDLLGQIVAVTPQDSDLHANAVAAIELCKRGIISYPSAA
jgi:ATP-dependent RNA helicase HelY